MTMQRTGSVLSTLALVVGVLALLALALSGPGSRMGWWTFGTGFSVMRWAAYGAAAAFVVGLLGLVLGGARARAGAAIAIGLAVFAVPWSLMRKARSVPPIHDITTDFVNPPEITASRAERDTTQGMNSWAYEGDSIAAQQRRAYPDIRPVMLALPPDDAYRAALRAARDMGWEILLDDPAGRRVEALDVTKWYGFKDDVAIRVTPASGISRVDIRSVSRVGGSDVGMNAERITRYVAKLKEDNRDKVADEQ